jgi:TrmH family RNA methyltransferase
VIERHICAESVMRRLSTMQPEWLRELYELRARKSLDPSGRVLVEGLRLVGAARAAGLPFEGIVYAPEFFAGAPCKQLLEALQRDGVRSACIPTRDFSALSYKAEGLVGVVRFTPPAIAEVMASARVLVLDGLSDPGNIGAVLRTANAWGPAGVVVVGGRDKLFHPKCLRASMGAVFHTPTCAVERQVAIAHLDRRPVIALAPDGDAHLEELPAEAIVIFGNERHGVHPAWHDVTTARVAIPMRGVVDSLNVATTAAIVLWEAFAGKKFARGG